MVKIKNNHSDDGYFLKNDVQYFEKLHELHNIFARKNESLKKSKSF